MAKKIKAGYTKRSERVLTEAMVKKGGVNTGPSGQKPKVKVVGQKKSTNK